MDILFGRVNPSGRLPYTIAKKQSDYPARILYESNMDVPQITYSEGLFTDYRHFDKNGITPRFPFGFGLSYTNFAYSGLQVKLASAKQRAMDEAQAVIGLDHGSALWQRALTVTFNVKNTGKLAGAEVSQLYIGFPASAHEPLKVLRGFKKTLLEKSSCVKISIALTRKDISIWWVSFGINQGDSGNIRIYTEITFRDVKKQRWVVPGGKFKVYVGSNSRDKSVVFVQLQSPSFSLIVHYTQPLDRNFHSVKLPTRTAGNKIYRNVLPYRSIISLQSIQRARTSITPATCGADIAALLANDCTNLNRVLE